MFSLAQKQHIAAEVEKILLAIGHPEMPSEKANFFVMVYGKEDWSWAHIQPNWVFENEPPTINPHNEMQALRCRKEAQ